MKSQPVKRTHKCDTTWHRPRFGYHIAQSKCASIASFVDNGERKKRIKERKKEEGKSGVHIPHSSNAKRNRYFASFVWFSAKKLILLLLVALVWGTLIPMLDFQFDHMELHVHLRSIKNTFWRCVFSLSQKEFRFSSFMRVHNIHMTANIAISHFNCWIPLN